MNIFEYLQTSHPWFDTSNYTPLQITLFCIGCVGWIIVYLKVISQARKFQKVDLPFVAIILNWGWEITCAVFFVPDMGKALVLGYWLWMVLDAFIVYELFKNGHKQVETPYFKKNFKLIITIGFISSFIIQYFYIKQYDLPMAVLSSYLVNGTMSAAFLAMVFLPGRENNSKIISWGKFLGTGIISIMFYSKYPDNNFLTACYIFCAVFDIWYIIMLNNLKTEKQ